MKELINKDEFDYSHINIVMMSKQVMEITEITYNAKRKLEKYPSILYTPAFICSETDFGGSFIIYLDTWRQIQNASNKGDVFEIDPFWISVIYGRQQNSNSNVYEFTDTLKDVNITSWEIINAQGEISKVKVDFICRTIERTEKN